MKTLLKIKPPRHEDTKHFESFVSSWLSLEFLFQNLAGERRVGLAFGETEFPGF
jgi:hypothetical protein